MRDAVFGWHPLPAPCLFDLSTAALVSDGEMATHDQVTPYQQSWGKWFITYFKF